MAGPVAIVTGGSRGIGRAIVEMLCEPGHRVLFTYMAREQDAIAVEKSARAGG